VDRICAAPGGREYGRLTVMVQARCAVERLFNVGSGAFQPPPRVESALVRLIPRPDYSQTIRDPALFADLVRGAFQQRRKMLRNALCAVVIDPGRLLERLHLDGAARPETLSVAQYIILANAVSEMNAGSPDR
jgi:16S rRNA (adenine1518-N6/adenine1519-N6)-dimethyltransferase